ncbi:EmrB/QacA family drug resistance transporter, partial [Leclercia adecarboxylata]|nr:EmrB/QacA family drug resistance transporter [Leclercia adecarboxylata]
AWLQVIQIIAQPMAVLPLLLLATGSLAPTDGPFASAWFNTVKGFAAVLAGGVLEAVTTVRSNVHSTVLVDRIGNAPWLDASTAPGLGARLHAQVVALTSADLYLIVAWVAVALIPLIPWLPTRIHPP